MTTTYTPKRPFQARYVIQYDVRFSKPWIVLFQAPGEPATASKFSTEAAAKRFIQLMTD